MRIEPEGELRIKARFSKKTIPAAEVVSRLVSMVKVADLSLPEPSIEEVIRRIYERTGQRAPSTETRAAAAGATR